MSDQFLGEIRILPFNFPPRGWATCDGQILAISQSTALFSLLGTTYGGDGVRIFQLPNLQDSVAVGSGNGAGLTPRLLGETGGAPAVTLASDEIPMHAHGLNGDTSTASSLSPQNNLTAIPATGPRKPNQMYATGSVDTLMQADDLTPAGGGGPHNNLQPYLTLNFCISLTGIFPARP